VNNPCIAHRGASGLAPENTLAAMREALVFPFVEGIELDVQLSSDGIPVVIHDDTLRRTTGRKGRVADYTAAELNRIDAGSWFSAIYQGETIPLLDQVLELTAGKVKLNVELKTYGGRYPGLEQAVIDALRRRGLQERTVITSFDPLALRKVHEIAPEQQTGLIIDAAPPGLVQGLRQLGASFLSIGHKHLNVERVKTYESAGLTVMAWTVNDPKRMRQLAAMSDTLQICTNYPDRFQAATQPRAAGSRIFGWLGRR
jgi:glycerophosphoryl diester phosphodiesterase